MFCSGDAEAEVPYWNRKSLGKTASWRFHLSLQVKSRWSRARSSLHGGFGTEYLRVLTVMTFPRFPM